MAQWNVISAFVLDQVYGFQTANKIRENLIAIVSARITHHLGGSRQISLPQVASAQDAIDYIDVEIDGGNLAGFTKQLRVECRSTNAGTSVTPKLHNVTDNSDAAAGAACSATTYSGTNGTQTVAATLANGVKKYRLQGTPSNTSNPTFVIGYLEIYAAA
jgi:hypothetical protein